jgi:hypothetical protein
MAIEDKQTIAIIKKERYVSYLNNSLSIKLFLDKYTPIKPININKIPKHKPIKFIK